MKRLLPLIFLSFLANGSISGTLDAQGIPPEHLCQPSQGPPLVPQGTCGAGAVVDQSTPGNCHAGTPCLVYYRAWIQFCSSSVAGVTHKGQALPASQSRVYFNPKYSTPACEQADRPPMRFWDSNGNLLGMALLDFDCSACANPPS